MFKGFSSLFEKKRDDQYEGESTIQEGTGITLKHGVGKMVYNNGDIYEGLWENDLRSGFGTLFFHTGEKYQGEWENDVQHGQGIASWVGYHLGSLGDQYDGKWERGLRVEGKYLFDERKRTYFGNWKDGAPVSAGRIEVPMGTYIGNLQCDEIKGNLSLSRFRIYRDNMGAMKYSDGDFYYGEWKSDMRDGFGLLTTKETQYYGIFEKNKRQGYGLQIYNSDGTYYEGNWKADKRDGVGKIFFPNGDIISGLFENDDIVKAEFLKGNKSTLPIMIERAFAVATTMVDRKDPALHEEAGAHFSKLKWRGFLNTEFFPSLTPLEVDELAENVDALSFSLASFIEMFQWTLPQKIQLAKGATVRCVLANCKDDIHSFADEVLEFIGYQHKIDGKIKRQIRRKILDAVCEKLYPVIFPMYNTMYRKKETKLFAVFCLLEDVTLERLGVSRHYCYTLPGAVDNATAHPISLASSRHTHAVANAQTSPNAAGIAIADFPSVIESKEPIYTIRRFLMSYIGNVLSEDNTFKLAARQIKAYTPNELKLEEEKTNMVPDRPFAYAIALMKKFADYKSPREKLKYLAKAIRSIMAYIAVREKEDPMKGGDEKPEEEKLASEPTTTATTTANSEETSKTEDGEQEGEKEQYKLEVNQANDQSNNKWEVKESKDSNKLDVPEAKESRSRRGSGSLSSSLSSLSSLSVPAIDRFLILCYVIVKAKLENMWSQYCYLVDFIKPEGERSEFLTALNDLGKALMFLSNLNTVGLTDERGVATPFPHVVIGLKVAVRQARDQFNDVLSEKDELVLFKKFTKALRVIGSQNPREFNRDHEAALNGEAVDETKAIDLLKLVKEEDRALLLANVDYLAVLFHSVGIRLVRKESNSGDVINLETRNSNENVNNSDVDTNASTTTSTTTSATDLPVTRDTSDASDALPPLNQSVFLQFRIKLPQTIYLRLAQLCYLLAFDPNYFLSDATWLTISKDLRMNTMKIMYLGENADLM